RNPPELAARSPSPPTVPNPWAEIRVIDAASGRGVPLVELETVNGLKFVTDNRGRVAFQEPGLMERQIFFSVRSHGDEAPKVCFGWPGRPRRCPIPTTRSPTRRQALPSSTSLIRLGLPGP